MCTRMRALHYFIKVFISTEYMEYMEKALLPSFYYLDP